MATTTASERSAVALVAAINLAFLVVLPQANACAQQQPKNGAPADQDNQHAAEQKAFRAQLKEFLSVVEATQRNLTDLETANTALEKSMGGLLTGDEGRRLANDESAHLVILYYLEHPIVDPKTVATKKRDADELFQIVNRDLTGQTDVSLPPQEIVERTSNDAEWVTKRLRAVASRKGTIEAKLATAPAVPQNPKAPTIQERIDREKADQEAVWTGAESRGVQSGRKEAAGTIEENARIAESKLGQQRAEQNLKEALAKIKEMESKFEAQLKQRDIENQEALAEVQRQYDEKLRDIDRKNEAAKVASHEKDVAAEKEAGTRTDAAEYERKKATAQRTDVKELLKPFTTPGYRQVNGKASYDRQAVSLKDLQASGALDASPQGLNKLLAIGLDGGDKERPRFGYPNAWKKLSPQQKDELKAIQNHLIDLGEVMVELKLLAP